MADLIDRQAAIDALEIDAEFLNRVLDDPDVVGSERRKYEWGLGLIESYISDMCELPTAQPEKTEYIPETKAIPTARSCVDLSEKVTATFYCAENEEWTRQQARTDIAFWRKGEPTSCMMIKKIFSFTIPGEPVGKGRPRFNTRSGHAYTPEKTASFENLVALECARAMEKNGIPTPEQRGGPVTLCIYVYEAMPKSWSQKKREEMFEAPCLKKPDIDNVVKSIMDGIHRAGAVDDDKQIFEVAAIKRWDTKSETIAVITYWGQEA